MKDDVALVLGGLPGFEGAAIEPLPAGTGVRAWRIATASRSAVIKLDREPRPAPGPSRAEEARLQQRAAAIRLAASVLWHSREGIMTEWLPGSPLQRSALRQASMLADVATLLRDLHRLPAGAVVYDVGRWASHYRALLERAGTLDDALAAAADELEACSLPGPRVFSHNDCVPGNIIDGEGLKLIDFEYAGSNSPLFDLATLIVEAELTADERGVFTEAYFANSPVPVTELDEVIGVYQSLTRLWQACRSPGIT